MKNSEAVRVMAITAQRFLPVQDIQKYVDYLRDVGISDAQIRKYSGDYVFYNSNLGEGIADDSDS